MVAAIKVEAAHSGHSELMEKDEALGDSANREVAKELEAQSGQSFRREIGLRQEDAQRLNEKSRRHIRSSSSSFISSGL